MRELTWQNSPVNKASFVASSEGFINSIRGKSSLKKFSPFVTQWKEGNEIIHSVPAPDFTGKKVLVIGGGPTTSQRMWDETQYDCLVTCNHFFLNERLNKLKFDLITVSDEVLLEGEVFQDYLGRNDTAICFENCGRAVNNLKPFCLQYKDRVMFASLRYMSRLGATPRLLCLVTLLGAKEIHVVGMDGFPKDAKHGQDSKHAFESGKPILTSYPYNLRLSQFKDLWHYLIHKIGKDVKYVNIGHGHPWNTSTQALEELNETI
jgi:hypothetical protein